jgi:hypothetical protein
MEFDKSKFTFIIAVLLAVVDGDGTKGDELLERGTGA